MNSLTVKKRVNIDMIEVDFCAGSNIQECISELVQFSKAKNCMAYGDFNGIQLRATPVTTVEELTAHYTNETDKRHQEYINSDEYKERKVKEELELEQMRNEYNILIEEFKLLDFTNFEQILNYIVKLQPYTDRVGINVNKNEIYSVLIEHGFGVNVNIGSAFNKNDKENFARYVIGQCLAGLECDVNAIHPCVIRFAEEWKNEFIV